MVRYINIDIPAKYGGDVYFVVEIIEYEDDGVWMYEDGSGMPPMFHQSYKVIEYYDFDDNEIERPSNITDEIEIELIKNNL
jgi:hypothetical protein